MQTNKIIPPGRGYIYAAAVLLLIVLLSIILSYYKNRVIPEKITEEFLLSVRNNSFDRVPELCSDELGMRLFNEKKSSFGRFESFSITGRKYYSQKDVNPSGRIDLLFNEIAGLRKKEEEAKKEVTEEKVKLDARIKRLAGMKEVYGLEKQKIGLENKIWAVTDIIHEKEREIEDIKKAFIKTPGYGLSDYPNIKKQIPKTCYFKMAKFDVKVNGSVKAFHVELKKRARDGWKIVNITQQ